VDPVSGFTAHAWTYADWVQAEIDHLQINRREVPIDLAAQMEDQLCQTLDPGWCMFDDPARPRVSTELTWSDMTRGLQTFGRWLGSGLKTVPQSEADRRALICSRCYLNVHIEGCSNCQKLVKEVSGSLSSRHDASLKGCAVCKCVLKVKVHLPQSVLDRENEKLQEFYPVHCWLNKDSVNYARHDAGDAAAVSP
jgi:hypothetical protein